MFLVGFGRSREGYGTQPLSDHAAEPESKGFLGMRAIAERFADS